MRSFRLAPLKRFNGFVLICLGDIYGINNVAGWPSFMFSVAVDSHNNWMLGLYENVSVLLFPKYTAMFTAS